MTIQAPSHTQRAVETEEVTLGEVGGWGWGQLFTCDLGLRDRDSRMGLEPAEGS